MASQTVYLALGSRGAVAKAAAHRLPSLLLMGEFEVVSGSGNCWHDPSEVDEQVEETEIDSFSWEEKLVAPLIAHLMQIQQ